MASHESIDLAQELGAAWVLMDERKGRRKLNQLGQPKIGAVGLLLKAKEMGYISAVRPELERLVGRGFIVASSVMEVVLHQAGE